MTSLRRFPFAALLWASLLLASQTLAIAHQHADDAPGTPCVVCTLAKAQTAACESATHLSGEAPGHPAPQVRGELLPHNAPFAHYRSRGPPQA